MSYRWTFDAPKGTYKNGNLALAFIRALSSPRWYGVFGRTERRSLMSKFSWDIDAVEPARKPGFLERFLTRRLTGITDRLSRVEKYVAEVSNTTGVQHARLLNYLGVYEALQDDVMLKPVPATIDEAPRTVRRRRKRRAKRTKRTKGSK